MSIATVAALIAVGVACALGLLVYGFFNVRRKIIRLHPDLQARWCALNRRTRRQIHRSQCRGQAPPVEHAAIALEVLDASDEEPLGNPEERRNRLLKAGLVHAASAVGGALLIAFADEGAAAIGIVVVSYSVMLTVVTIVGSARTEEIRRNRPAARVATLGLLDTGGDA